MVGYTSDGISSQEQTRWLSWNVEEGVRGFDMARNHGLRNTTAYGVGEFPLPTRQPAGAGAQSTSKPPSMFRSKQTEESYPDLSRMKRELESAQRPTWIESKRFSIGIKPSLIATRQYLSETRRFLTGICRWQNLFKNRD